MQPFNSFTGPSCAADIILSTQTLRVSVERPTCSPFLNRSDHMILLPCNDSTLLALWGYLAHHKNNLAPLILHPIRSLNPRMVITCDWDLKFVTNLARCRNDLYDLLDIAIMLDISPLVDLVSSYIAMLIKGRPQNKLIPLLLG